MNTYITHKPKMKLVGVSTRTTNTQEAGPERVLQKLWETYFQSGIAAEAGITNPQLIYALYTDYVTDATGEYSVVIGHEINLDGIPTDSGKKHALIPESKYLVFTSKKGPIHEVVPQAWETIWDYFRDSPEIRTYTGDFEVYDAHHFDSGNVELQIYIAIQ
ncbi:GyrI-like domain-containing protein [Paenibacillus donghaensis]|uniref:AraC family transcriptional regulator n=1 Tax=Paenibacillus donghaensis TaxID=414771 RepID=A0A2Z2K4S5_9BACL|nr:GyrI-like domain-containing protein [Paenibacillus donghaensis]ASA19437.1 AraC family transcriptional regulator [Paenibacillus donghaensis]